jgi:hypothetical protein
LNDDQIFADPTVARVDRASQTESSSRCLEIAVNVANGDDALRARESEAGIVVGWRCSAR